MEFYVQIFFKSTLRSSDMTCFPGTGSLRVRCLVVNVDPGAPVLLLPFGA